MYSVNYFCCPYLGLYLRHPCNSLVLSLTFSTVTLPLPLLALFATTFPQINVSPFLICHAICSEPGGAGSWRFMGRTWRGGGVSTSTITPRLPPEILATVTGRGFCLLSASPWWLIAERRCHRRDASPRTCLLFPLAVHSRCQRGASPTQWSVCASVYVCTLCANVSALGGSKFEVKPLGKRPFW